MSIHPPVRFAPWRNPGLHRRVALLLRVFSLLVVNGWAKPRVLKMGELVRMRREAAAWSGHLRIEGTVGWSNQSTRELIIYDETGIVPIELDRWDVALEAGTRVGIEGRASIGEGRCEFGTRPLIDNDGTHVPRARSGSMTLTAGLHPVELDYFQRDGQTALKLRYEGPGVPLQEGPKWKPGRFCRDFCG